MDALIVTLTLNPALDVSTTTERVVSEHKLRCGPTRLDPGGGGVNVSRTVDRLGGRTVAVVALGGPTGELYRRLLDDDGVTVRTVPIAGTTRESFTVRETTSGEQFRFVLQGPQLSEPEWRACLAAAEHAAEPGGYLIASGSLPPGVPDDVYAQMAARCRERGIRFVADASGPALRAVLDEGAYLVTPSRRELEEYLGAQLPDTASQVRAARELVDRGAAELVALTLGASGAVLATADGVEHVPTVPTAEVHTTVGAGDCFLGAFVLRLAQGADPGRALRAGVAAGTAATLAEGTGLGSRDDVERFEAALGAA